MTLPLEHVVPAHPARWCCASRHHTPHLLSCENRRFSGDRAQVFKTRRSGPWAVYCPFCGWLVLMVFSTQRVAVFVATNHMRAFHPVRGEQA